jgi:hypothetical protein
MEGEHGFIPEEAVQPTKEKVEKLFGHCFEIRRFEENDAIPVGGESVFAQEANIHIAGDFQSFSELNKEIKEKASGYDLAQFRQLLDQKNISLSEETVAKLFAFSRVYDANYPREPDTSARRRQYYSQKQDETIKLSDIMKENVAECAEITALSQWYLQGEKVDSSYFSGDVLWKSDQEFAEEHSFILIRDNGQTYIYDPTNPVRTTDGKLYPSIYSTEADFNQEVRQGKKQFLTAKNVIFDQEAYFGVNNGTSISPEKDII